MISVLAFFAIILILFIISILAIVLFIVKFKKNKLIYKSVFASLFRSFSSLLIIIVFYSITFSLIGAFNSYSVQIENSLSKLVVDKHSHQVDFKPIELELVESAGESYNNLFEYSTSILDPDNLYTSSFLITTSEELISEYDNFFSTIYGYDSFWETTGFEYFQTLENFISTLVFWTTFNDYNNGLIESVTNITNSEIVYNIYPRYVYSPILSDSYNETYYMMGYNEFPNNPILSQFFRYSGENGEYVLDDLIFDSFAPGYNEESVRQNLSEIGTGYSENGTKSNPFKIVIQDEYVEANDINLSENNVIKINDYYFEIMATANFSNIIFPIYSANNFVTDFTQQAAILMNPRSVAQIANGNLDYSYNFGYTDIYDQVDDIYYYSDLEKKANDNSTILEIRADELVHWIYSNTEFTDSPMLNDSNAIHIHTMGLITGEEMTLESYRVTASIDEINKESSFLNLFMYVFLVVIIFILILLIQKRVKDYSKQFGTLKALGLNRNEASVAFLVYPIFIIGVSGFIALLLSIPLQYLLIGLYTSFFSIPAVTIGFSFWSIFYVVLFPALILFAISAIISSWILRKPPIDLLSNKINDEPNILVIASGKLVPENASFSYAYKFKGLSRAWGKSFLLIVSIFFATSLTALSLAASTLIDDVQTTTNNNLNYNYVSFINETKYDYDFYDINETNYTDSEQPLYPDQLITQNSNWDEIKTYSADQLYALLGDSILQNDALTTNVIENGVAQYYIPKEALWNYYIMIALIKNDDSNFDFTTEWVGSQYSASDFNSITRFFRTSVEFNLSKVNLSFKEAIEIVLNTNITFENVVDYSPDFVFKDIYYNSNYQTTTTGFNTKLSYSNSEESILPWSEDYENTKVNIFTDPQYINNVYDIPEESVNALEEEEINSENSGGLDYIPVVIDSFTFNYIQLQKPDLFTDNGDGTYSTGNINTSNSDNLMYYTDTTNNIINEPVNVKIVDVYPSFLSFGFTTTEDLVLNYEWDSNIDYQKIYYESIFWNDYLPSQSDSITLTLTNQYTNTNNGDTVSFGEYVNNSKVLQTAPISKTALTNQTDVLFTIVNSFLLVISLFAMVVAIILTVIAVKDINDKSKKEVAMLKALGYSNGKSVSLVLTPYIFIIIIGFIISIPFSIIVLLSISSLLTGLTGSTYSFTLTFLQWIYLSIFIIILISFLLMMAYNSFRRTNPLDAIKEDT